MVTAVIDYLIVVTDSAEDDDATPAGFDGPMPLPGGARVEQLEPVLGERLLDATELRGERWAPTRQYSVMHAYVRDVPQARWDQNLYHWDDENVLWTTLALSRLIRSHATACDHAVRRIIDSDGTERLVPHDAGEQRVAFRVDDGSRNWLSTDEAEQLGALLAAYEINMLPPRVQRAITLADIAARERFVEGALPLVVGGIEALLKVGRQHLSAQFEQRTPALAAEVGIDLTREECAGAYDDRSGLVHGGHTDLSAPATYTQFMATFDALHRALRGALRLAIEQPTFAAVFNAEDQIHIRWPTLITPRRGAPFTV